MVEKTYKYIYGPVNSWRLGSSLGIDLISRQDKVCSFECVYCQLGKTKIFSTTRKIYVGTNDLLKEFKSLENFNIDYITFSGMGEPTLALNLGEVIKQIKKITPEISIAVLTNSSLIDRDDVKQDLKLADFVMFKLDTHSEKLFQKINKPAANIKLANIINGIKDFKKIYKGKLSLQVMFINDNKPYAKEIAEITRQINPHQIQINTPLRPCDVISLSQQGIEDIKQEFSGLNVIGVYDRKKVKQTKYLDENAVVKRRPNV